MLPLLAAALASPSAVAAEPARCPATSADLAVVLEDGEVAFAHLDEAGFREATDRAATMVACLTETVARPTIARLHRLEGLRAWADDDRSRAVGAFAAARAIEPAYVFPSTMVPIEHPIQAAYAERDPGGPTTTVPAPARGQLLLDGRATGARPLESPALVQWIDDTGAVRASAYLWPGAPMLEYPTAVAVARRPSGPPVSRALAIVAASTAVASGAAWAGAKLSYDAYWDAPDGAPSLDGLRGRTNALWFTAVGTGVAALGTGAAAVIVGSW